MNRDFHDDDDDDDDDDADADADAGGGRTLGSNASKHSFGPVFAKPCASALRRWKAYESWPMVHRLCLPNKMVMFHSYGTNYQRVTAE